MKTFNLNPIGNQTPYPNRAEATGPPWKIILSALIFHHIAVKDRENHQTGPTSQITSLFQTHLAIIWKK